VAGHAVAVTLSEAKGLAVVVLGGPTHSEILRFAQNDNLQDAATTCARTGKDKEKTVMGRRIGIDLGTTNSVIAVVDGPQPKVLPNRDNRQQMRSVVSLKKRKKGKGEADGDGEVLVGDVALDNWPMAPRDTILSVKRLMGRGVADPDVQKVRETSLYEIVTPSDGTKDSIRVVMGGRQHSPVEISAMILKKLKEDAEFRLGEEVTHAVITVPAYFNQRQKGATREAGLRAGLNVIKILDEPTAAAIAFGIEQTDSTDPKYILVYDLGGGTFDISVLMWAGNIFAPLNLQGDMWLGGDNFDQILVDHAIAYVREEHDIDPRDNMRFMVALKKAARETKERLSSAQSADLVVPGLLHDSDGDLIDVEMEVTRAEYERMVKPLIDRTVRLTEEALKHAELTADQIDHVIMAGNATCLPKVQEAMENLFGRDKVLRNVHPKNCVAMGAALVAARLQGVVCQAPDAADPKRECGHVNPVAATKCAKCGAALTLSEGDHGDGPPAIEIGGIAPYHYGVQTASDEFHVFIDKGDQYPTDDPRTQTFYTRAPNQRMISIPVYGGENRAKASANEKQGEAFAVLPPNLPKGTAVRIKVWLDGDGVFGLSAHLEDGTDLEPIILEGEKDQKAVEAVEGVEAALAGKAAAIPADEMAQLEAVRQRAFNALRQRRYDDALGEAGNFGRIVDEAGRGDEKDALRTKAENLIGYAQFVIQEYGWALNPEKSYSLNKLVDEVRQALEKGDLASLKAKVDEIDHATDQLPDAVRLLLGLRGAIQGRIRSIDPVTANNLLDELSEVERALRANDSSAPGKLAALAAKVAQAVASAQSSVPKAAVAHKCPLCGAETGGKRHCPNGHDQWLLDNKTGGASSSGKISSV
jgi:molecular chaperone DnaK (HSP70)